MKQKENLIVALYERLSHDDELRGESCSISNQKALLEGYAKEHGLTNYQHFFDDGISGTRFDRPGFMEMMEKVKDGAISTIIVKDMSRLGRDYLMVGQITEMLRQKDVRLIYFKYKKNGHQAEYTKSYEGRRRALMAQKKADNPNPYNPYGISIADYRAQIGEPIVAKAK